jgi:hypothetical protein
MREPGPLVSLQDFKSDREFTARHSNLCAVLLPLLALLLRQLLLAVLLLLLLLLLLPLLYTP